MPQYRETLGMRWFETVKDIVRCHPEAQRPRWVDRFFYQCEDGVTRPIAELWPNEGPALLRSVFAMLRLSESHSLRAALRLTIPDPAECCPSSLRTKGWNRMARRLGTLSVIAGSRRYVPS